MPEILMVTARPRDWAEFADILSEGGWVQVGWAKSGEQAIAKVEAKAPLAVILDEGLSDTEPLALASRLLKVNAFVSSAVVSRLSADDFHEAGEGLGLLGSLAPVPDPKEAADLRERLKRLPVIG